MSSNLIKMIIVFALVASLGVGWLYSDKIISYFTEGGQDDTVVEEQVGASSDSLLGDLGGSSLDATQPKQEEVQKEISSVAPVKPSHTPVKTVVRKPSVSSSNNPTPTFSAPTKSVASPSGNSLGLSNVGQAITRSEAKASLNKYKQLELDSELKKLIGQKKIELFNSNPELFVAELEKLKESSRKEAERLAKSDNLRLEDKLQALQKAEDINKILRSYEISGKYTIDSKSKSDLVGDDNHAQKIGKLPLSSYVKNGGTGVYIPIERKEKPSDSSLPNPPSPQSEINIEAPVVSEITKLTPGQLMGTPSQDQIPSVMVSDRSKLNELTDEFGFIDFRSFPAGIVSVNLKNYCISRIVLNRIIKKVSLMDSSGSKESVVLGDKLGDLRVVEISPRYVTFEPTAKDVSGYRIKMPVNKASCGE